ncbi:DUF4843 domain-containing protein [Chitinophaga sp. NPDC101104]|uniref:DUF4843 domain-containing protein n=1 Tax=Chitinophaga sp. NPDC101104 TaxID=3390561 RepID=UPI003D0717B1
MKKLLYLLPVAVATMLAACEKSPLVHYDEGNTIYFKSARGTTGREPAPFDSINFTFMYVKGDTVVLPIPVSVAGKAQPVDRAFDVIADTGSTAEFGKHMSIASAVIRANSLNDTLFVKLFRTEDMKTNNLLMRLKLVPNQYFQTDMASRKVDNRIIPFHVFRVFVTARAIQPVRWLDAYFGVFTAKKARLMTDLFGFNFEADFNPPYGPTSNINFVTSGANAMHRYLQDMDAAGTPVFEEDGSKMTMGSFIANQ